MADKIVVIVATAETEKAAAGLMYAVNARKHEWLDEVHLVLFGPAEKAVLADEDLQELLLEYGRLGGAAAACRFLSDRDGTSGRLAELGLDVRYVGPLISDLVRGGCVPMVW